MSQRAQISFRTPKEPIHPGDFLSASVLPSLDASITQAARELGVSRQTLYRVISGESAITPELALLLEDYSGTAAEVWLLLQVNHDLWRARAVRASGRDRAA